MINHGRGTATFTESILGLGNADGADADFSLCVFDIGSSSRRNYLVDSTKDQLSLRSCRLLRRTIRHRVTHRHTTRTASMTPLGKRIVAGALIAAAGAFAWALLAFSWTNRGASDGFLGAPLYDAYAVLITSWFVLPMGGFLGALLPRVFRGCTSRRAFGRWALLGLVVGVVAAMLTTLMMEWPSLSGRATIVDRAAWDQSVWRMFGFYASTMSVVCSIWVGVWTLRWSRRVYA